MYACMHCIRWGPATSPAPVSVPIVSGSTSSSSSSSSSIVLASRCVYVARAAVLGKHLRTLDLPDLSDRADGAQAPGLVSPPSTLGPYVPLYACE